MEIGSPFWYNAFMGALISVPPRSGGAEKSLQINKAGQCILQADPEKR